MQGLEAAIMFPSGVGVSVEGEFLDDPAANAANVRAYNRWVQDDWGFGVQEPHLHARERAAREHRRDGRRVGAHARRRRAHGAAAARAAERPVARAIPTTTRSGRASRKRARVSSSTSNYTKYQRAGAEYGYDPDTHYFDGFDAFQWFSYWGDRPIMETVAAMIFHNLFTRFPDLHVGIIEHGAVWAPYAVRKMDHGFMMGKDVAEREARPSARATSSASTSSIAPYPEENITRILDVLSPDCLVFGSDFPHPEGLPDPVTYVNKLHDLSDDGSAEDHEHQPRRVPRSRGLTGAPAPTKGNCDMDHLLWTNSGDSHFIEPPDLFKQNLPPALADRLPRSEKVSDTEEIVHIDGRVVPPSAAAAAQAVDGASDDRVQRGDAAGWRGRVEGRGAPRASRRPGCVGRGRVPVARALVRPDRRPASRVRSGQGAERPRARRADPHVAAVRAHRHAAVAVGRAVDQGGRSAAPASASAPSSFPRSRAKSDPYWNDDQWEPTVVGDARKPVS